MVLSSRVGPLFSGVPHFPCEVDEVAEHSALHNVVITRFENCALHDVVIGKLCLLYTSDAADE